MQWKFWVWRFYWNMRDAFIEGLPYITHFVVFYSFRMRPKVLLTLIRYLALVKSNFNKKGSHIFQIKFKQFHTFGAYSKLECVFTLYDGSIIFEFNNFDQFLCAFTFVNCFPWNTFYLLLRKMYKCLLCCTLCWCYMYRVLPQRRSNNVKNEIRN